jgi:hypothetical protein
LNPVLKEMEEAPQGKPQKKRGVLFQFFSPYKKAKCEKKG